MIIKNGLEVKFNNNNNNISNDNNNNIVNNETNIISEFYKNINQSSDRKKINRYYRNNKSIRNNRNIRHNIINKKESSNPIKRKNSKIKKDQNNINNEIINPNNKNKKENKNKKRNNNDNAIERKRTRVKQVQGTNINEEDFPYGMKEKEMYEMFLKIYNKTDAELNDLNYEKALQFDYRTYTLYYVALIRINHLFFFSFWPQFDYNSRIIKIFLFFFNFAVSFATNSLFFDDETMHKIYEEKGAFNFIYNIPQIIISSIISGFILGLIQILALSDSNIIDLKNISNKKNVHIIKRQFLSKIKIKLCFFFIISLLFLISFWIYLGCFCFVYKNTQIHLIKDTFYSFGTSMISPFFISILPPLFRIPALRAKKKDKKCLFRLSKALQLL